MHRARGLDQGDFFAQSECFDCQCLEPEERVVGKQR